MNCWMQLELFQGLLHLRELVNGNLAFNSESSVLLQDSALRGREKKHCIMLEEIKPRSRSKQGPGAV